MNRSSRAMEVVDRSSTLSALILLLVGVFLASAVAVYTYLLPKANSELYHSHNNGVRTILNQEAVQLEAFVEHVAERLEWVASSSFLKRVPLPLGEEGHFLIPRHEDIRVSGDVAEFELFNVKGVVFRDAFGRQLKTELASQEWMGQLMTNQVPYYFRLLNRDKEYFTFMLAVPVRESGEVVGYLSADVMSKTQYSLFHLQPPSVLPAHIDGIMGVDEISGVDGAYQEKLLIEPLRAELVYVANADPDSGLFYQQQARTMIVFALFVGIVIAALLFAFQIYSILNAQVAEEEAGLSQPLVKHKPLPNELERAVSVVSLKRYPFLFLYKGDKKLLPGRAW